MRALIHLAIAVLVLIASPATAADILVVQSLRDVSFSEILKGFRSSCSASVKTVILSDYSEVDVPRIAREEQPTVIVTIGEAAYSSAKKVRRVPIVALMSPGLSMTHSIPGNVTGVGMVASPDHYMRIFGGMGSRRVGVIFNPSRSGGYLGQARRAADRVGVELVALEVRDPRETLKRLETLKGRIDALWVIPDTTVVSPITTEAFFLFSMEQWKPVVGFAGSHLALGAAAVLDVDRFEVGRQGGEIARRLLGGASAADIPFQEPAGVILKKNIPINQKLGIRINESRLF